MTQEVPAPAAGVLAEIVLDTDAEAVPGALLGRIDTEGSSGEGRGPGRSRAHVEAASSAGAAPRPRPRRANGVRETRFSPSVRRALPAARHRSGADPGHGPRRADHARGCRPRGRARQRQSASASRDRAAASLDIPHDRMRLKIAENMVRAVAEAPHVTALFEADFSAVAAHKAAMARTRRQAQLHRLYRQGGGRSDGGRAGDQRPLGAGPDRDLADHRHRRRHRARRKGPGRAGGQGRRLAQPGTDRRASSTTSPGARATAS